MDARTFIALICAVTIAAVVAGLIALGSPAAARGRRLDERRVDDLVRIGDAIDAHRSQNGALPRTLNDVEPQFPGGSIGDPATQQPYEYRQIDGDRYELCAVFQQPSRHPPGSWAHMSGRQCFKRRSGVH